MIRTLILIAAFASITACASAPRYAPAPSQGAPGYSETQIEANRYFVTYRASATTEQSLLYDYALLRAADLTLQNGREWFWVDRRSFDGQSSGGGGPRIGVGVGGATFGGNSSFGGGVGVNVPLGGGGGGAGARAATLEVRMGEGPKPDDPNTYDARAIALNLRARHTP